jgi:hypothetical protein
MRGVNGPRGTRFLIIGATEYKALAACVLACQSLLVHESIEQAISRWKSQHPDALTPWTIIGRRHGGS